MKKIILLGIWLLLFASLPGTLGDEGTGETEGTGSTEETGFRSWFSDDWNFSGAFSFAYQNNSHLEGEVTNHRFRSVMDAILSKNNLIFGATFEVGNFFPRDPDIRVDMYKRLDKIYVQWMPLEFDFTLGDYYAVFGRGITLNLTKNDKVVWDQTLRGVNGVWEHGNWSFQGLTGILNNAATLEDDVMAAGRISRTFMDRFILSGYYVFFDDYNDVQRDPLVNIGSASLELLSLFDFLDIYGELAISRNDYGYLKEDGHAGYLSANFYHNEFTFLFEFKDYENFNYKFNSPPTGDYEQEFFPAVNNRGFRILPQYHFAGTNTSVFFNLGRYESPQYDFDMYHYYAGVEQRDLFDRIYLYTLLSFRKLPDKTTKFQVDTSTQLTQYNSLLFSYIHRNIEDFFEEYSEDEMVIGFSRAPMITFSFLWQYSERLVIDQHHFFGGEIELNLLESLSLKFFGGSLKGGVICSGGTCYFEKPFKGVKLAFNYRF